MGYNDENAGKIVIDIECIGSPDAAEFLDPVHAPSTYKDPIKIAAYIEEKARERVEKAGLEPDLCEIVAVGWQHPDTAAIVYTRDKSDEGELIAALWGEIDNRAVIGFNVLSYDLPVLIRRSQLLGEKYPNLNLDRYRTPHVDLMQKLTFNGALTYRSLGFYARRFGIPSTDQTSGADIAQMVAAGDWTGVASHCRADVEKTAALARRLGWLPAAVEQAEAVGF